MEQEGKLYYLTSEECVDYIQTRRNRTGKPGDCQGPQVEPFHKIVKLILVTTTRSNQGHHDVYCLQLNVNLDR